MLRVFGGWFFLFILVVAGLLWSVPAFAVEYGSIGGKPANPRSDNPRTTSIFIHTLNPGQTVSDAVKVINNTSETKTLLVYATDSLISSGGAFACEQKVDDKNRAGSWLKLEKGEVVLPPNSDRIVKFKLAAPGNVDVGEHNACIVIQEKKAGVKSGEVNIRLSFRTAIRVAILVPGTIVKKLEIVDFTVTPNQQGDFVLQPKVRNTGNVSLDADVDVAVRHFWGAKVAEFKQNLPVQRGAVSEWNFELKRPKWGGWYRTKVTVDYDANPGTELGSQKGKKPVSVSSREKWFYSAPAPLYLAIEIALLLFLAALGYLAWRRWKQYRLMRTEWVVHTVKRGENINRIAERVGVPWQRIAKASKLKPPYTLKAGDKIKVPPKSKTK